MDPVRLEANMTIVVAATTASTQGNKDRRIGTSATSVTALDSTAIMILESVLEGASMITLIPGTLVFNLSMKGERIAGNGAGNVSNCASMVGTRYNELP
jgi:hypothetical protein